MKFYNKLLILVLVLLLTVKCQQKQEDKTLFNLLLMYAVVQSICGGETDFWVRNLVTNSSECVNATLMSSGSQVNIYLDNRITPPLNYNYIKTEFDSTIKPNSDSAFGPVSDINHDSKTDILITDIKDGATPSSGYVAGFFDPVDFFSDSPLYPVRSNEKEILYIDGNELVQALNSDSTAMVSTIAHEFQHLIRFQYIIQQNSNDPTWINEGTSEVASEISYGTQTSRLKCFNGSTCTGGVNGIALLQWENTLQHYAYAYSFMSYLYGIAGSSNMTFLKNSVTGGANGIRANTTENLVNVFKTYNGTTYATGNFPATDNATVYKSLLISFLGQAVNYTNLNTVYIGTTSSTNIDSVRTAYPLPTTLNPIRIPILSKTTLAATVYPGAPFHVNGTTIGTNNSDIVVVQGAADYMLANGAMTANGSSGSYAPSITTSLLEPIEFPTLQHTEHGPFCPLDHLTSLHKIETQLMKLNQKKLLYNYVQ